MSKIWLGPVALLIFGAATSHASASACALADLRWMAGSWHNRTNPDRAQERWVSAPGGVLMGSAWEFPPEKSGFAEIMTIRREGDSVIMILRHFDGGLMRAWEERAAPMIFSAVVCAGSSAIFDGQGDHIGEHLTYKRSGKNLLIIGDFLHGGTADREEWNMVRAED
jgi:Domain of unknown function (DUF6265)